jgi:diaminohydroxyphosphoribosylaminopyrimidine deaminase / 5-amino-6-(5-phosphoribosylamino)uracil reductase
MTAADDLSHMRTALALARRNLGAVWPNPAVGCVLVKDGRVVGRGWTQPDGRPHAETEALARAQSSASGATAYVSLEPCSHHGRTPPCAEALIKARVARVVTAIEDPDPRVFGRGLAALREAGIKVETGLLADEAAELNAGFLQRVRYGRPLVTLKTATTLDGRIATHRGESRWITGEPARQRSHVLRAEHDAILIGVGTAMIDDPDLTCRLPGLTDRSPVRIVVDPRLRLSLTAKLVQTARKVPTWFVTFAGGDPGRRQAFMDCGIELIDIEPAADGQPDMTAMMEALGKHGITRVLVEGGSRVSGALLAAGLIDRIVWFRASMLIGGDGAPVAAPFGVDRLSQAPRLVRVAAEPCGDDLMEIYARR